MGISMSMRTTERGRRGLVCVGIDFDVVDDDDDDGDDEQGAAKIVLERCSRASRPWFATCIVWPSLRSEAERTRWLIRLSSTMRMW